VLFLTVAKTPFQFVFGYQKATEPLLLKMEKNDASHRTIFKRSPNSARHRRQNRRRLWLYAIIHFLPLSTYNKLEEVILSFLPMPTLQINIISEQTIPNILFIKQFEGQTDGYVFVSTPKMNQQGQLQAIIEVCQIPANNYQVITVNEESLADVETQLEALHFKRSTHYLVNITGGTKIMSLGVYSFFSRFNSQMYYLPIGKNDCKQIFPPANETVLALQHRVSLQQYLQAYGIGITNLHDINSLVQNPAVTQTFLNNNVSLNPLIRNLRAYKEQREYTEQRKITHLPLRNLPPELSTLNKLLQNLHFKHRETKRTKRKRTYYYLLGQWLEEYVYSTIKNLFGLDARFMGNSVAIHRQQVANELDVVLIYNNTIYVIECKTGLNILIFNETPIN
jgi:hypothetical protein